MECLACTTKLVLIPSSHVADVRSLPGSVEELYEKAMEGCCIQLPLSWLLILEAMVAQHSGVHELEDAILTGCMHALLSLICTAWAAHMVDLHHDRDWCSLTAIEQPRK